MKRLIWTKGYRPWIMGGDVHGDVGAEIDCLMVDLGKGFTGLLCLTPKGTTVIAEASSGAIVGRDLESVRHDIEIGEQNIMEKQVADALQRLKRVEPMSEEDFWAMYER